MSSVLEMLVVSPRRVCLLFLTMIAWVSAPAGAQPPRTDLDQLTRPKTVPGLWSAIKTEMQLGKFDTAATYLKDLLALEPTDKDLVALEERDGIAAFLELNAVPKWSDNQAFDEEAKKNVKDLINRVTAAVRAIRSDPERIQRYIRNLTASPEERDYALIELRKSGPAAMPYLIGSLISGETAERRAILRALTFLDQDTIPALLAAFDIPNPATRVELLDALSSRKDLLELLDRSTTDPRPTLWRLAAGDDLAASKAKTLLSALLDVPMSRLPLPAPALVQAAEDMYQHRNTFAKEGPEILIWKWEENRLTSRKATPSDAEEYFGLRYARWALELEPRNEAAWATYYSLAAEKALERSGPGERLSKASPAVHELVSLAPPRVLYRMLDRALTENHPLVALAAIQVIGERAEIRESGRLETLVKALNSQDRRLAMGAADALIRMPGEVGSQFSSRIVEVYRAALGGDMSAPMAGRPPRVLIAEPDEFRAKLLSEAAEQAGWSAEITKTGRETISRLAAASDIDAIWVSEQIVYPTLHDVLSQARADYRFGHLPLVVYVPLDVAQGRLPEITGLLDRLEYESRGWLIDDTNISAAVRASRENGGAPKNGSPVHRLLEIDRTRYPIRVELRYDALKLSSSRQATLQQWLDDVAERHPTIRQITTRHQRILISIARVVPGLNDRLAALTADIPGAIAQRLSESVLVIDLPTAELPNKLAERLARLLRDFGDEIIDDFRTRLLNVERELPTKIVLTMTDVPPELPRTKTNGGPTNRESAAQPVRFDKEFEREKLRRILDPSRELRLDALVKRYRNTLLVAEPLNSGEFLAALKFFNQSMGLVAAPLTEAEVKDRRQRAMEALRQMALGILPGYDVRPATGEILRALGSDDIAALAVEAASRLASKDVQHALAQLVLDRQKSAELRRLAATHLVSQIQQFGLTSLDGVQIAGLVRQLDEEGDAGVKASISSILGSLPQDRILSSLEDPQAKQAWQRRALNFQPPSASPPMPTPMNEPKGEN
ncbi:MAG: hypothetical protein N2039_14980 [Gemmataceae bacterium]|nr:hypothetical protein [Gemmataceae bacterium]